MQPNDDCRACPSTGDSVCQRLRSVLVHAPVGLSQQIMAPIPTIDRTYKPAYAASKAYMYSASCMRPPQSPTCPRPRTPNSKSASNQRSRFRADYVMLASLTLAPGEIMSRDSTCRMASAQPPHVNSDPAYGMHASASDMWRTKGQQPVRTSRSTLVQGLFHAGLA